MTKNNNVKIKICERLSRLEADTVNQKEKLDSIELKLDDVRLTIEKWKGTFTIIASTGGIVGGAIMTILLKLLLGL